MTDTTEAPRPMPSTVAGPPQPSHAELTESAAGWALTVTLDEHAIQAICQGVDAGAVDIGDLTVSISPNLVPGVPFDVSTVRIVRANPI